MTTGIASHLDTVQLEGSSVYTLYCTLYVYIILQYLLPGTQYCTIELQFITENTTDQSLIIFRVQVNYMMHHCYRTDAQYLGLASSGDCR